MRLHGAGSRIHKVGALMVNSTFRYFTSPPCCPDDDGDASEVQDELKEHSWICLKARRRRSLGAWDALDRLGPMETIWALVVVPLLYVQPGFYWSSTDSSVTLSILSINGLQNDNGDPEHGKQRYVRTKVGKFLSVTTIFWGSPNPFPSS